MAKIAHVLMPDPGIYSGAHAGQSMYIFLVLHEGVTPPWAEKSEIDKKSIMY